MKLINCLLLAILSLLLLNCHSKKTDINKATMMPVVKEKSVQKDFQIFNQPNADNIVIVFYSTTPGRAMVSVYCPDGKLLQQRQLVVNKGTNTWNSFFQFNSSGTYLVKFKMSNLERMGKVFKTIA